jgi:crotonobetainyl-CoA:carnitine CoA-transferase CaiB-like acyl-CoA transferase
MRRYEPRFDGESAMFTLLNRGKKSLVLDLKDDAARDKLMPLLARADVLVEQFRPGVMTRLGLGYETVRAINPRLIYCSITGYGQTGPRAEEAGHDLNYIGHTGLLALNPGPPDRPVVPPALIADIAGGTLPAVMNILLALRQRDRTGQGRHIDIAMTDAMFTFAGHAIASGQAGGTFPGMGGARLTGGSPRYQIYPAKDGKLVCCAALEQRFWEPFTAAIGLAPEFIDDRRDPAATKAAVAAIIAGKTADEWRLVFAKTDCCVTIMATLEEALHDPHFVGRGLFAHKVAGPTGAIMPALPVPIDPAFRDDPAAVKAVPRLSDE